MGEPYKELRQMMYTEFVYFSADGIEIGRERNYDDTWYDTVSKTPLTEDEIADWGDE